MSKRICIIGAGPSGLAQLRAFQSESGGLSTDVNFCVILDAPVPMSMAILVTVLYIGNFGQMVPKRG